MGDTYFNDVVLGLHMDGANASTVFTDLTGKTVTVAGNTQISTAQSKFGGASALFDGAGDYLGVASSSGFGFGTGAFTLEMWIYSTKSAWSSGPSMLLDFRAGTGNGLLYVHTDGTLGYWNDATNYTGTTVLNLNAWHHLAMTYDGTTLRLFVDGNMEAPQAASLDFGSSKALRIGAHNASGDYAYQGYIDDLRITKGVARYTVSFSVPTEAFPDSIEVVLVSAALTAPSPTLSAFGGDNVSITAPSPVLAAFAGGYAELTAPSSRLAFTAHNSYGENATIATAPRPTLQAYTGGNASLTAPSPTLDAIGTGTGILVADLTAPSPSLASTGTSTGILSAELEGPSPNLIGYGGAVCSITGPMGTLVATGTTGSTLSAAVTVPMAQLTASVTRQGSLSALLTAPSPRMGTTLQAYLVAPGATLTAIGSATITATYEAYALNLNHPPAVRGEHQVDEMTRYTNFPFTQVVRYKNSYYGVAAGALYLLEGTTDDATPIPFAVQTAKTDFGVVEKKTLTEAYFGGRLGPAETISLVVGESGTETYSYTTPRGATAQNYRQVLGKGVKARYYALGVAGDGIFELDTLDLNIDKMTRRI